MRKAKINRQNFVEDKMLPSDVEIEKVILGAMIIDRLAPPTAFRILKEDSFYSDANNTIFRAMAKLYQDSKPIDLLTVTQELRKNNDLEVIGGGVYMSKLTDRVASAANIEAHCRIIEEKAMLRRMIVACTQSISDCYSEQDAYDIISNLNQKLIANGLNQSSNDVNPISRITKQMKIISNARNGIVSGVMTGLKDLDHSLGGLKAGELIIIAARPGMGKTALNVHLMHCNVPTVMFQLEMSEEQLAAREIAMFSGISADRQNEGKITGDQEFMLSGHAENISNSKAYVDSDVSLNPTILKSKLTFYQQQYGVKLCIIDYLSLMEIPSTNRVAEIEKVTRGLKLIAKELKIPIILNCQLNREVEKRSSQIPQLSDLRDSGAIEQDADVVIFIYRPEYYNNTEYPNKPDMPVKETAMLSIAKNRQGGTGNIYVGCQVWLNRFFDITQNDDPF